MDNTMTFFNHVLAFDHPEYVSRNVILYVLAFVAAARLLSYLGSRLQRGGWSPDETLRRTTRGVSLFWFAVVSALWGVLAVAGLAALSEPYEDNAAIQVPVGGVRAVFALDESGSEGAEYYRFTMPMPVLPDGTKQMPIGPWGSNEQVMRWLCTKKIMPQMPGNKIGLVAFTADARVVSQLREDYDTLEWMLNQTDWLSAPGGGSDPSEGLSASIQALRKGIRSEDDLKKRQIIFIFCDGGITDIEPQQDSGKVDEEAKKIWFRDFGRTLKSLQALKDACLQAGGESPEVILVGLGGDTAEKVPLYYDTGERVRNEKGEPQFFPFGAPPEKVPITKFNEANLKMLQQRINEVVPCRYQRIPLNWDEVEKIDWVKDVIHGTRTSIGKHYWTEWPLLATMALLALLCGRGIFHSTDAIARNRAPAHR
jgi:uncharacterized membrane protein